MATIIKNLNGILGHPSSGEIKISANRITEVGNQLTCTADDTVIDARGCIAYPGFVNTHHHLAQSVLKGIPAGLNQPLGEWLASVPYQYWPRMEPKLMHLAAKLGLYEQLRSGVTTCADHHYLYHQTSSDEMEAVVWQAAEEFGIRFVLCRGGANMFGTHKGLVDAGIQPEALEQTLDRLERTRKRHHQTQSDAMNKLVVAPTSLIHSSNQEQLITLARYARSHQLRLHSHLLEVDFDEQQAQQQHGVSAVDYAEQCEWLGDDVWFAHLVKADTKAIETLARTGTGIAHCPTSNLRLGSGIAPVVDMAHAGMPISIGVDGSASSESGSMLQEVNLAWLLHRATHGADATRLEQTLQWATQGGAELLGYEQLGQIDVGQLADIVLYDIDAPRYAGVHDSVLAPAMLGEPATVRHSWVNGHQVVDNGVVAGIDEAAFTAEISEELSAFLTKIA